LGGIVESSLVEAIKYSARLRILYLPHALDEMNAPDEMIMPEEVQQVVFSGEIVEDYPADPRGHSCLMLGYGKDKRPVHVVCAPEPTFLAVITVYVPTPNRWESDWKTRKPRK
jgi:hypothetical protein